MAGMVVVEGRELVRSGLDLEVEPPNVAISCLSPGLRCLICEGTDFYFSHC